jgi:MFS family permease
MSTNDIACVVSAPDFFGSSVLKRFCCQAANRVEFDACLRAQFPDCHNFTVSHFVQEINGFVDLDDSSKSWDKFCEQTPKRVLLKLSVNQEGPLYDPNLGAPSSKETPLPRNQVVVLMCFQLSEALSINMLFPIVPFLVKSFDEIDGTDSSQVSYYASIIASTFNLAQFVSSFWWGAYSDKYGRRPVLLFGMAGSIICLVAFGLVKSLSGAIFIRAMHGLLNGNAGVTKTYMREITDSSNQTRGMALFGTFWGIGSFVGPAIGGFMSFPAQKMPGLFPPGGSFDENPFLLPFMTAAAVTFLGWILGYCFLEETVQDPEPCINCLLECLPCSSTARSKHKVAHVVRRARQKEAAAKEGKTLSEEEKEPPPGFCSTAGRRSLAKLLRGKGVCIVLTCYMCIAFVMSCLQELFPLWASLPPEEGGLGFVTTEIGAVQMVMGVALILYTTLVLPIVGKCCGVTRMYQSFSCIYVPVCILTPFIHHLLGNRQRMWAALVILYIFRSIAGPSTFTAIGCLVNNAAAENIGAVNGIATSATALARAAGPAISGQVRNCMVLSSFLPVRL